MKLLLTGFEPFGTNRVNPSEQVVRAIAGEPAGAIPFALGTAILPVDRNRGPAALIRAFEEQQPDIVLCLGEASKRMTISIERVAINLMDYRIADNAGNTVVDEPIIPAAGAPAAYFVTLPVRAMLKAARACGVPTELSLSAGAYLCNQVAYSLLHHIAQNNLRTPAGFVHLPALPEQAIDQNPSIPSMSLETMLKGIRAIISVLVGDKRR